MSNYVSLILQCAGHCEDDSQSIERRRGDERRLESGTWYITVVSKTKIRPYDMSYAPHAPLA